MRTYLPFFYAPLPVDPEVRRAFRREWVTLLESGPIADPTQIFLELACFNAHIAELLRTVRSIEGFTVVCLTGRDALDMITLARVFAGYVDDTARISSSRASYPSDSRKDANRCCTRSYMMC